MKSILKIFIMICLTGYLQPVEAQLLKRLKKRVEDKLEQKVEKKVDKTLENIGGEKSENTTDHGDMVDNSSSEFHGSAVINHSSKYGNFSINEFGKAIVQRNTNEVRIYGSWVTHAADIHDGYVLVIPNGNTLLFDKDGPKQERVVLSIPDDVSLELSYDPVWAPDQVDENGFAAAVSKDYQSYRLDSGEVVIDVLAEANLQVSFSGEAKLVTRTRNPDTNSEDEYLLSYSGSSIDGAIDVNPIKIVDGRTVQKTKKEVETPSLGNTSNDNPTPGTYQFTFETQVRITNLKDNQTYNMSYLLNPNATYIGIKADMGQYSNDEMDGESIIVMDRGDAHIFVEAQGMKMRMSQGMMGGEQIQNPTDKMAQYDYTRLKKTGNTKNILGATCYEYIMSDANVKITLWVAPDVNLPNWFVQSNEVINGHIMAYVINSKDGHVKSETIAINDGILKNINPKEYKKMF